MATTAQFDARLSYDDLVRLPDDGLRHEIIDGAHYVTPSPVLRHQTLVKRLLVMRTLSPRRYCRASPSRSTDCSAIEDSDGQRIVR